MEKQKVIEKVKKILALAENNPNENEAIAAALKAQKLMAQFHINEKELGSEVTENNIDRIISSVGGKTQRWKVQLAQVLAKNFRCRIYLIGSQVVFYGYEEDIKICSEVFQSMYKIGVKLSDKLKRETRKETGTAKGIRNTFCYGFVMGIKSELEKQCTALMIVVPKEVNESFENATAGFSKKKTSLTISNDRSVYEKRFSIRKRCN